MGMFDIDEAKLRALYHRAELEANRGYVETRKYPYLDKALMIFAQQNGCSYDDALVFAKTGKRLGGLQR